MSKHELIDGEPCEHRLCLSHISHPCEGCGRIGGIPLPSIWRKYLENLHEIIGASGELLGAETIREREEAKLNLRIALANIDKL